MFGFGNKEKRGLQITQSARDFLTVLGISTPSTVSMDQAIGVPAVWAAVNFLAGTIAGLPLHVYDKTASGKKKVKATKTAPIVSVLHDAVNDGMTSFDWRFGMMWGVLTEGRFVSYIERDDLGRVINLFPIIGAVVSRDANFRKVYTHKTTGKDTVYSESEVLDVTFALKPDLLTHRSPLRTCAVAIGKAHNATEYGSKLFANGGMPSHALAGPFGSGKAAERASDDITEAVKHVARQGGKVLAIPLGHELKPLGIDPEKMQMVETQRFNVEEIARIYSLPPTFLQDLSRATFSNSEQQDLHLVKHTVKRWLEQIEAEMNLKLFGRNSNRIAEFNLDGLLRGDYLTRMNGNAQAINTGQLTPNEARALDNREPLDGGDQLYIQGATVPLTMQATAPADGVPQND
jgi:HK97 family phage portal protein